MGVIMQAFYWDCPKHEGKSVSVVGSCERSASAVSDRRFYRALAAAREQGANLNGPPM